MNFYKIFSCALLITISIQSAVMSQIVVDPVHKDTLILQTEAGNVQIQWQRSNDGIIWTNIANANSQTYNYVVNTFELPVYFRAEKIEDSCDPYYSDILLASSQYHTFYWSDPHAWQNNQKPVQGDFATIPHNRKIFLDENTAALSGLTIDGILEFLDRDLQLTSDWIHVHGRLQVGTEANPFQSKAIITLTGSDISQIAGIGTRGIMVMDGQLELHGNPYDVVWTKINEHITAGSTNIPLVQNVPWQQNDEIVLAPTDYYLAGNGNSVTQKLTISGISNNNITVSQSINAFRWGLLQYATTTGLSLSPQNIVQPPAADVDSLITPTILDERATVGNLSRNIVIQAPEDNLWTQQGIGVHIMIMGLEASAHVNGVEIKRGGQRGRLGRYPFHWHMLSYGGTQTFSDATGQYFRNSTINRSTNRGVVIHGTNGLLIQKNIIFDIEGHGIFTEDAAERRNVIDSNLVLKVRNPQLSASQALKQHEIGTSGGRGSSGFWISNPDNIVTNNIAADCGTNGFWLPYPVTPFGLCSEVLAEDGLIMNPSRIRFGRFDNNTAHSNGLEGIMLDFVEINDAGNVTTFRYISTTDGRNPDWQRLTVRTFTLSNYKVWKNLSNGIWDRADSPYNYGAVSADNCGRFFAGAGRDGIIERCLAIGTSLNHMMNGTGRPAQADFNLFPSSAPAAFATYHSTFDIKNNIAVNFQGVAQNRSGVFSTDDYYIRAVEKGQYRNTNNLMINSHAGVKLYSPFSYFTLASCLWDPNGIWGPAGNFYVYDDLFFTHGKTITSVSPGSQVSGGVSVPGPFYGFDSFVLHGVGNTPPQSQPYAARMAIHVRRLDNNFNQVATWSVTGAQPTDGFSNMRDFATTPDGIYELTFPDETIRPTDFRMNVENMLETQDMQVICIEYDGTLNPQVRMQSQYPGFTQVYTQVNSLQDVVDSQGETWWQDKPNNRVWVKLRGGRWQSGTSTTPDDILYETTVIRIFVP
jgi:hypothetical protein